MAPKSLLDVGHIAKPHGLQGEVIVALSTDRVERLDPGTRLESDRGTLTVEAASPHQRRWRVRFAGCESREDAEALAGVVLRAAPIEDDSVWFVHDLVDLEVVLVDGNVVGTCTAVMENPAHALLELDNGILVPLPFVTAVDERGVVIDPPEGLLDPDGA